MTQHWALRSRKGLSEKDARWYFKQLMLALDYCHKMVRTSAGDKLMQPTCLCPPVAVQEQMISHAHVHSASGYSVPACICDVRQQSEGEIPHSIRRKVQLWSSHRFGHMHSGRVKPRHKAGEHAAGGAAGAATHAEAVRCARLLSLPAVSHTTSLPGCSQVSRLTLPVRAAAASCTDRGFLKGGPITLSPVAAWH